MIVRLRDYQERALTDLRALIVGGHRRLILVAPTGAGKTTIAAQMIKGAIAKGSPTIFLAHRKELIDQCSARLDTFEVPHGIIKAGTNRANRRALVQVASVQTMIRRELPPAKLIIVDEAHRTMGETYLKLLASYPEANVIGLTATPIRLDGQGLGDVYTSLVEAARISELVEKKVLMAPKVYAPPPPDLKGVKTTAGDYNAAQLELVMNKSSLIGDLVHHWQEHSAGKRTVCFATSVAHSLHIRDTFREAGITAEHVDGTTHPLERERILRDLQAGVIQVVTNVNVLTEGWDCPEAYTCILARPTQSLSMYLQMVGRVLRTHPEKDGALVLDHAGCTYKHGLATEDRLWELYPTRKGKTDDVPSLTTCPSCYATFLAGPVACPECLKELKASRDAMPAGDGVPETEAGHLVEVTGIPWVLDRRDEWLREYLPATRRELTMQEKQRLYDTLCEFTLRKKWKPGFAGAKFKEITGKYPPPIVKFASKYAEQMNTVKARQKTGLFG